MRRNDEQNPHIREWPIAKKRVLHEVRAATGGRPYETGLSKAPYPKDLARASPRARISGVMDSLWGRKAMATNMFSIPSPFERLR